MARAFPIPGGSIEVTIGGFDLRRCRCVTHDGASGWAACYSGGTSSACRAAASVCCEVLAPRVAEGQLSFAFAHAAP